MNSDLTCYVYGFNNQWEDICTDLDIATQGHSLCETKNNLKECIDLYLEYVMELPFKEHIALINRPSPVYLRIKFILLSKITPIYTKLVKSSNNFTVFSYKTYLAGVK